jgi:septum formation protein
VLASGSPQRQALLRAHGYEFDVVVSPHDEPEHVVGADTPAALAEALSRFKAQSVRSLVGDALILAGDTVVALRGELFGKPCDRDDARRIIGALAGTRHEVITGVTLLDGVTGRLLSRHARTVVVMRDLHAAELEAYLDSGAWEGKAGAYGIQDRADAFIDHIEGSFSNVVGFPMELVSELLEAGV